VAGNVQLHVFRLQRGATLSADFAADGDFCSEYNGRCEYNSRRVPDSNNVAKLSAIGNTIVCTVTIIVHR